MQTITTEIKVGIFVVIAIVFLGYMTVRIGDLTFGRDTGYLVYGVFDSVAGLDVKAPVKMAGVAIGSVETIGLDDSRAKVGMRINPGIKIKKGVVAAMKTESLLGERYVELLQGDTDVLLTDGGVIEKSISVADIDSLITRIDSVAVDIKSISSFFSETLGDPETKKSINEIIVNMRNLTASLSNIADRDSAAIEKVISDLNELIAVVKDMAVENREPLKTTVANLHQVSEDLRERAPGILERVDKLVDRVEKGEGTVGKLMKEDGLYNKLDSALSGVEKYISATDRFKLNLGFRGEY